MERSTRPRPHHKVKWMLACLAICGAVAQGAKVRTVSASSDALVKVGVDRLAPPTMRRLYAGQWHVGEGSRGPDGASIVCVSNRSGNRDLWIRTGEGLLRQLTFDPAEDAQPAWSPNGRHILFVSSRGRGETLDRNENPAHFLAGGIWMVPAFGGAPALVIEDAFNPSWSPDGARFAFDASFEGARRIWSVGVNGEDLSLVSEDDSDLAAHTDPAWSPDGRWIAYARQSGRQANGMELWLAPSGGGPGVALLSGPGRLLAPAWGGPGRLVFLSDRDGAIDLWRFDFDPDSGQPMTQPKWFSLDGDGLKFTRDCLEGNPRTLP